MPYRFYFGMYNVESIGARSAKSSECMADDGPNREPTLVPCMALSNPSVLWMIPSAPPWEWRNKHPLMATYNGKGMPLVLVQVPVLVEVFVPYGRPFVPSPSNYLSSEVLNVMGIVLQLPTVLPSNIPSSSPSSFERRVLCLWQLLEPCVEIRLNIY